MAKNYYAILGVLPDATLEEIKSAYRRRAKQYHPDHFGQNSAPFLNVQEAYDVLSDPAHRSSYDRKSQKSLAGATGRSPFEPEIIGPRRPSAEPLRSNRGRAHIETISPLRSFRTHRPSFDEMFDPLQNAFDIRARRKAERFETLTMEVLLSADEAACGGSFRIALPVEGPCPTCAGSGDTGPWPCWRCSGIGSFRQELPLEIEYPPGIRDNYQIGIPLDRFGIHDIRPVLIFRITPEAD